MGAPGRSGRIQDQTNLNQIFSRLPGGSSSEGITIYVQSPAGGTYSALLDSSGTPQPLENLVIPQADYTTPWSSDTGNSQYVTGTYTIWAKCDVNSMYDNYGIPGKTISQQTSLLDQEQNPLISVNVPTTIATTQESHAQTSSPPTTQSKPFLPQYQRQLLVPPSRLLQQHPL